MSSSIYFLEAEGFDDCKLHSYSSIEGRNLKTLYDLKKKTLFFSYFQKEMLSSFNNKCNHNTMLKTITRTCEHSGKQHSSEC